MGFGGVGVADTGGEMSWKFPNYHRQEGKSCILFVFDQIIVAYLIFPRLENKLKFKWLHTKVILHNCITLKLKPAFNTSLKSFMECIANKGELPINLNEASKSDGYYTDTVRL